MNTTTTTSRNRKRLALAVVAAATAVATWSVAAAQAGPPTWEQCAYRDHPVAADVGGILPVNFVPSPEMQAARSRSGR